MKKTALFVLLLVAVLCFTSCIAAVKTHDIITENVIDKPEVVETSSSEDEKATEIVTLTLYFPDNDALYLHKEERLVEVNKGQFLPPVVIEELFKGPVNENHSPCLDGKDLVSSIVVEEGLCTIDFKEDFAILNSGGSARETFVVGSIVNSLCNLDGIERVKINIGGDENAVFGGHFTLDAAFSPQTDLISAGVHDCP